MEKLYSLRLFFACLVCSFLAGASIAQSAPDGPARTQSPLPGPYKNIPTLEELSGIWLRADTMSIEPSVRNFRAQALLDRDMTSLSWFASAPYVGGYHTGVLRIDGAAPMASFFRWYPYQALRKTSQRTYDLKTTVRMVPDQDIILWQLEITNTTGKTQTYDIEQDLIGFISRYANEKWPWKYPFTGMKGKQYNRTKEMINVRANIGIPPDSPQKHVSDVSDFEETDSTRYKYPSDKEILQSAKYHILGSDNNHLYISDNETSCVSAFTLVDVPAKLTTFNSGGTAGWSLKLKPGETKKIRFLLSYAPSREEVTANLKQCENSFDQVFNHIPRVWKERWETIFRPNNGFISGTFPILQTTDKVIRKVYYTGPLTMLYLLNLDLPQHKRVYLTGGPRWGATTTFFWDITEWSTLFAVVDPAMMKEQLRSWVHIDPGKYFGKDNYGGQGDGNGYVANYWALFQLMRSYITVTHDYDFLNEVIDGKKLIDHLEGYAYNWKRVSIYGQPGCTDDIYKLADFGSDPWNLLECVPTYIHIVPSFNAGYVWMMRETARLRRHLGDNTRAQQLDNDAAGMAQRVLKLYAGNGVWNSWYPDNKKVEVRHVMDFMFLGKYMAGDMPDTMKRDMIRFVNEELLTDTWMRAQSLKDVAAKSSDRPDHGPLGAYDGWPAGTIDAMSQMGHTKEALAFYRRLEPVTYEGCWAQAHELWGDNKLNHHARVRIPERGWTCRDASAGIDMSQNVLKDFFGFYPSVDGEALHSTTNALNFTGTLYNVLYGGKYYTLSCRNGKTTMTPASVKAPQSSTDLSPSSQAARKAPIVTNFFRRTTGWISSDGGYTIPLSNGSSLWLMGDSHIDDYDTPTATVNCLFQVRNAALLQPAGDWDWRHTRTLTGNGPGIKSYLKNNPDDHFFTWPSGGIQLKDTVYIFCNSMKNANTGMEGFGFAHTGIDFMARVRFPDMKVMGYTSLQDFDDIGFGIGFIKEGHWVYTYGQKMTGARNDLFVARFPETAPCGPWQFWDGGKWTGNIKEIRSIADQSGIDGTFQVCKVKDSILLVSSELSVACDQGKDIYTSLSSKITGPFSTRQRLYTIDDTLQGHYPFFYLAAAHPEYIDEKKELLFTYSINGYGTCVPTCVNGRMNPDYYRLKAFRVPLKAIGIF
ncbi:MAG TPA: hypothetical protein VHD83_27950 [Puia sp.]|nr:hypothetical protein [Puia sp.]